VVATRTTACRCGGDGGGAVAAKAGGDGGVAVAAGGDAVCCRIPV